MALVHVHRERSACDVQRAVKARLCQALLSDAGCAHRNPSNPKNTGPVCADPQECFATRTLAQLRERLGEAYHDIDVFAIDEAQFFPDLLAFCTAAADAHAKHLLLAGLDGDFRRQRFGQARRPAHTLTLNPTSDHVTAELACVCRPFTPSLLALVYKPYICCASTPNRLCSHT